MLNLVILYAKSALSDALASIREPFEPETTAHNLRIIRERRKRGQEPFISSSLDKTNRRTLGFCSSEYAIKTARITQRTQRITF
jgi:hypothetical protein